MRTLPDVKSEMLGSVNTRIGWKCNDSINALRSEPDIEGMANHNSVAPVCAINFAKREGAKTLRPSIVLFHNAC